MASELPPTYYFTDITFNPAFYSSGSDNITNEEAKKNYLTYPTAQGTETISTLNSSTITSNSYKLSGIPKKGEERRGREIIIFSNLSLKFAKITFI